MKKLLTLFVLFFCFTGPALAANPQVELKTSEGIIVLELFPARAPSSVRNFLQYVRDGHYDGTIFHRVISGFMVQGGGFDASMRQKAVRPPIRNEANNGLKNDTGTVAMARTNFPDSATSQFFINMANNDFLNYRDGNNWGYAVFGKVVQGMDVARKIEAVTTGDHMGHGDVPKQAITIITARELPAL